MHIYEHRSHIVYIMFCGAVAPHFRTHLADDDDDDDEHTFREGGQIGHTAPLIGLVVRSIKRV